MPPVKSPPFGFSYSKLNATDSETITISLNDMLSNLGTGIIVLPLIALMEDVSVCKAFGKLYTTIIFNENIIDVLINNNVYTTQLMESQWTRVKSCLHLG